MSVPTFECAACHGTFEKGWTDAEAESETIEKFGCFDESFLTICDDCFKIGEARQADAKAREDVRQAKIAALSESQKVLHSIIQRAMVNDYVNFILYGESRKPKDEPKDD